MDVPEGPDTSLHRLRPEPLCGALCGLIVECYGDVELRVGASGGLESRYGWIAKKLVETPLEARVGCG